MEEFTLSLQPETQGRGHKAAQPLCGNRELPFVTKSELKLSLEKTCRGSLTSGTTT